MKFKDWNKNNGRYGRAAVFKHCGRAFRFI